MNTFNLIFICLMFFGFILIIYSLIQINKIDKSTPISSLDKSLNDVRTALDEADIAIEDLNFISEEMFNQFEKKQKELMFLYESIEKKKNANNLNIENQNYDTKKSNFDIQLEKISPLDINLDNKNNSKFNHPLLPKIKELLEKNYTISEIAKELNIGKGELEFIIKLEME